MPSWTLDVFRSRHVIYKVLLLLGLPLGLGLFLAGFASRRWTYAVMYVSEFETGLWEACERGGVYSGCVSLVGSAQGGAYLTPTVAAWFAAVQVLQCLALAGIVCGVVLLSVVNFRQCSTLLNRIAAGVTLVADVLGILGSVVYAGGSFQHYSRLQDLLPYSKLQFVSVSYGLNLAGLLILFFVASLVALFDQQPRATGGTRQEGGARSPLADVSTPSPPRTRTPYSTPYTQTGSFVVASSGYAL